MNRETIIKKMRDIDLIDFRDEDEDEHVAELVNKVSSIVAMAVAKEAESRKAAQAENADLKERLARSGIEQRRAVAKEREECAKVCESRYMGDMRMVLCPKCGNKRCPHANDHRNDCTGSNEPGQPGSAYPAPHGITAKAKKE